MPIVSRVESYFRPSSSFNCANAIFLWQALHHPFTAPNPDDIDDLPSARALAYDMVYNGVEVATITQIFLIKKKMEKSTI